MTTESPEDAVLPAPPKFKRNGAPAKSLPVDRLPPHASEAEQGVLGCCLLSPVECLNQCAERFPSGNDVFYDLRHQVIYGCLMEMHDDRQAIDVITLQQRLKDQQQLDQIGGIPYLNSLQDSVPSAANVAYYCDIVAEKYLLRKVIHACVTVSERVYEYQGEVDVLINEFERDVLHLNATQKPKEVISAKRAADELTADMERRFELGDKLSGLDTGLIDLNYRLDGLQACEQVVVGARPSMGKTALGMGFFLNLGVHQQIPSLFISLEMTSEALMRRAASAYCSIPLRDIKKGKLSEGNIPKLIAFNSRYSKSPVHIVNGISGMTCREVCAVVRRMVLKHGIKLVIIDYLQKIKADIKHEKRTYEIGDVSGKLKALAVETGVAMVTLAQLNRENVQQKGRPPRLSDLADSGQIERDADTVLMIHRGSGDDCLIVGKQRDGETGIVPVYFNGTYCRFENCKREEKQDEDWANRD